MQLSLYQFLVGILLIPFAATLQTIYFGEIAASGVPAQCIAFFSDSDPCNDGTTFGPVQCDGSFCNQNITILGHPDITFTGCKTVSGAVTEEIPTGVSDGGAPALKCKRVSNPPGGPDGAYAACNGGSQTTLGGFVNVDAYCS